MIPQKINIIPETQEADNSNKPLLYWKKIKKNQEKELHLILLFEGRSLKETYDLGKELWDMVSAYENELTINQNGLSNPEYVCETILKICNDYLGKWGQNNQISAWSELGMVIAVANQSAIYFARIGKPRLLLFRNNQIVLADENLSQPRSPQFSPPFSELAGGSFMPNDRLLLLSGDITDSFSWEEISSLISSPETSQVYYNIVRSLEVLEQPKNAAFLIGDLVPFNKDDSQILEILKDRLKEHRIGELYFQEYSSARSPVSSQIQSVTTSYVPWKEIVSTLGSKVSGAGGLTTKIVSAPFKPIAKKFGTLSSSRKVILVSFFALFFAFVAFITRSIISQPEQPTTTPIDFKVMYEKAAKLKEDAQSALIYQDEEKARKNLAEAATILEQVSQSSDWGIKSLKMKDEVDSQLATLDKAQSTQATKIWSSSDPQSPIKQLGLSSNGEAMIVSNMGVYSIKTNTENPEPQKLAENLNLSQNKGWLVPSRSEFLYSSPQDKSYYVITNKNVSEKKELPSELKESSTAIGSFDNFLYTYDPEEMQIKQFIYGNNGLSFKTNWFKQDVQSELKNNPIVSMAIEGNIFFVTKNGNFFRFSGGKKIPWDVEKPGASISGDNLTIETKAEDKNVYLLDQKNKRVVIIEKETGKLRGQLQNAALEQAMDFQVDEKNKNVYFVTSSDLFKLTFTP